jgi:hypothetical protein
VQMGQIQPACFGWPSHFGLVAHHGRTEGARPMAALAVARPPPACRRRGRQRRGAWAARQHGTPDWGSKRGSSLEGRAPWQRAVGRRGTAAGAASGGVGRWLAVSKGGT